MASVLTYNVFGLLLLGLFIYYSGLEKLLCSVKYLCVVNNVVLVILNQHNVILYVNP